MPLAKVVTDVPAVLSRRLDPRAGAALVWGSIHSGGAHNVIPSTGKVGGTLRMLDAEHLGGRRAPPRGGRPRGRQAVCRPGRRRDHQGRAPGRQRRRLHRRAHGGGHGHRLVRRPDAAVARRRGLRVVPHPRARRHGPARDPLARRPDLRPAPRRPRHRRGRDRRRSPHAGRCRLLRRPPSWRARRPSAGWLR